MQVLTDIYLFLNEASNRSNCRSTLFEPKLEICNSIVNNAHKYYIKKVNLVMFRIFLKIISVTNTGKRNTVIYLGKCVIRICTWNSVCVANVSRVHPQCDILDWNSSAWR